MPNTKTARELITELLPGKHIVMHDPKRPEKIIAQCVRVSEQVYYLTGPQFNDFGTRFRYPLMQGVPWELPKLFEAGHEEHTTEAETVDLINFFFKSHGARLEDCVFTCANITDTLATLAGLFAAY